MTKNNKTNKINIALIGATGIVGRELINILEHSKLNILNLYLYSSQKSAGEKINFKDQEILVKELPAPENIQADLVFLAAGNKISQEYAPKLASRNILVIDKSSFFRMKENNPLIAAHANDEILNKNKAKIISSPNCVATPLCQALAPLHKKYGLSNLIISTYQAVSGAGLAGSSELESQVRNLFNLKTCTPKIFDQRIAFNILPMIPSSCELDNLGQSEEEVKIIQEVQKILETPDLKISATCVRVPVFSGHCISVSCAFAKSFALEQVNNILKNSPGIILIDNASSSRYPSPVDAVGENKTLVGRVRHNNALKNGLSLWIAADNLRVGAALNAVYIAEKIYLE